MKRRREAGRITGPQWAALRALPAHDKAPAAKPARVHSGTMSHLEGLGLIMDCGLDFDGGLNRQWRRTPAGDQALAEELKRLRGVCDAIGR